jgi:uncharacterized protein (TIGR00255 family)
MAIRSMTGFGRATATVGGVLYGVEIRSVNHRFLDLKIRLPRRLGSTEPMIRRVIGAHAIRGRFDVLVQVMSGEADTPTDVVVNHALAARVRAAHAALAAQLNIPDAVDTAILAAWPGVLQPVLLDRDDVDLEAALEPAVTAAVVELVQMRAREGAGLEATLKGHFEQLSAARLVLEAAAPAQVSAYRARLTERLKTYLGTVDLTIDEGRILHEVAVFADKSDVAEELARLETHLAHAHEILGKDVAEGVGRRLDFLCQELLREVNTTGSKVQDVGLSETVIALKSELERLREQVQNIE